MPIFTPEQQINLGNGWPSVPDKQILLSFPDVPITPTTYNNFIENLNNSTLLTWVYYMFDYTPAWISNVDSTYTTGNPEQLVVLATSPRTYSPQSYSLNYPTDIVHWDYTPRTTTTNHDYWFTFNDWALVSTGTYSVDSIDNNEILLSWTLPALNEYVYFEAYDDAATYYRYTEWTRQDLEDDNHITFVDNLDGTYTMTILILDQNVNEPFIPTVWNFTWFIGVDYITNSTTGMIVRRETNKWLVADFDFRWVIQARWMSNVLVDWVTRAVEYLCPNQYGGSTNIWDLGAIAMEVQVLDAWDYEYFPIITYPDQSESSYHITWGNPFQNPWSLVFVDAMINSTTWTWCDQVFIGRVMADSYITDTSNSYFLNGILNSHVYGSMSWIISERWFNWVRVSNTWQFVASYVYLIFWLEIDRQTANIYIPNSCQFLFLMWNISSVSFNGFYNSLRISVPSIANKSVGSLTQVHIDTPNSDWSFGSTSVVAWVYTYTTHIS